VAAGSVADQQWKAGKARRAAGKVRRWAGEAAAARGWTGGRRGTGDVRVWLTATFIHLNINMNR
jgi:hypothetical protein